MTAVTLHVYKNDPYKTAVISKCGRYRYVLRREWDEQKPPYVSIMLNPSTADAVDDDPTIRRNLNRAGAMGFGSLIVCNLGAGRATSPRDWMQMIDPIGPENDLYIEAVLREGKERNGIVVAGWGTLGGFLDRGLAVRIMARKMGVDLYCLGVTMDRHPRHPLYVRRSQPMGMYSRAVGPTFRGPPQ